MRMRVFIDRVVVDSDLQGALNEAAIAEGLRASLLDTFVNRAQAFAVGSHTGLANQSERNHRRLTVNVPATARPAAIGASLGTCLGQSLWPANNVGGSAK